VRTAVIAILLVGCGSPDPPVDGETITVRGRVVDAEGCASTTGCRGVEGLVVALASRPDTIRSAPTGVDGTFELADVPAGYRHDLVVTAGAGLEDAFAPTLNPSVLGSDATEDQFGLQVYALPRGPESLLEALRREGYDLVLAGGYVGQTMRVVDGTWVEASEGVSIEVYPAQDEVRYVAVLPRYVPDEPPLRPRGATSTGAFGLFAFQALAPVDPVAVVPAHATLEHDVVAAPLVPGMVTFGIHRVR